MSIYWNSPKDGQCCECRPNVCDPCEVCPSGESVEVTLRGIEACCSASNRRMTGLGAITGVHTLARVGPGEYAVEIADAVSLQSYAAPGCTTPTALVGPYAVTITFICGSESAALDIWMTVSGVRLFYAEIALPAAGELFVFTGAVNCTGFTPYTYGGTVSL